jgi:transposase
LIQGCRFEEAALSRGDLSEVEWRILKILLPVEREPGKRGRGRPPEDNRNVINGILWRLRTGAPWRDVPEKYGNWNSIYRRFRRWSASGVWESVAIALAETMAESGHYNIDSTTVRAHVSAAGGKGGLINELLAARGAGSPVKFIVSVMPEAGPSPSISRQAKRRTVKPTILSSICLSRHPMRCSPIKPTTRTRSEPI